MKLERDSVRAVSDAVTMNTRGPEEKGEPEANAPARRPYEKPSLTWEWETELRANVASACSLVGGAGGTCETIPSS